MTGKAIKNVTVSMLAKLRNTSRSSGAPLQQVLQLYAMERFLYRIAKSRHAQSVILKGALLLKTIGIPNARPTVDIDMLRKGNLEFDADALLKAIEATFKNRETPVAAEEVEALTTALVEGHRVQWNAFVRKIGESELIDAFGRVVDDVKTFAIPVLRSLANGERLTKQWKAGPGWVAQ